MRTTFFVGDLHLGHANSIIFGQRPVLQDGDLTDQGWWVSKEIKEQRCEEQDELTIERFNKKVSRRDTTVFVGDVAWCNHNKYIQALNGKKILVKGNHDKMSQISYNLFSEVTPLLDWKKDGKLVVVCHYPMFSWRNSCRGSWHIHGHTHNSPFRHPGLGMNVGIDLSEDFAPFEWETEVRPWFEAKEEFLNIVKDHHDVPPAQEVRNLLGDILDEFRKPEIQLQRERLQEMYDLLKTY